MPLPAEDRAHADASKLILRGGLPSGPRPVTDAQQQPLHAQVLVEIFPMDPCPTTAQLKLLALRWRCAKKSGEIGQRDGELTAIRQPYPEIILVERHGNSHRFKHSSPGE